MQKLSGAYYLANIDLTDVGNQIKLARETREAWHSVHIEGYYYSPGFQNVFSTWIFAGDYDQLTSDLCRVAVFVDDLLISGANA